MKLTHSQLKKIIREELEKSLTTELSQALGQRIKCAKKGACPEGMILGPHKSSKNPCGCHWPADDDAEMAGSAGAAKCPKGQMWVAARGKCVRSVARAMSKASKTPPGDD